MTHKLRALLFFVLVYPAAALADKVPPPPEDCPKGSVGETSHGGPYCEPTTCADNSECQAGFVCQEQALCIETETYTGGRDPSPRTREVARDVCGGGKACASPATCETKKRCVPASAAGTPATSSTPSGSPSKAPSAKGYGVSPESDPSGGLWILFLLGVFLMRRRIAPK